MIWPVCFISVAHLFQIHLYTSEVENGFDLMFPLELSWTEPHQLIVRSLRNAVRLRPCSDPRQSLLIARCNRIDANDPSSYRCDPSDHPISERRSKRAAEAKTKRPSTLFLALVIGIPCLIVGIVGGLIFMAFWMLQRRSQSPQTTTTTVKPLEIAPPM